MTLKASKTRLFSGKSMVFTGFYLLFNNPTLELSLPKSGTTGSGIMNY